MLFKSFKMGVVFILVNALILNAGAADCDLSAFSRLQDKKVTYSRILKELGKDLKSGILSKNEKFIIHTVLEDASPFDIEASKGAFSVYLKSRLKHLPPRDAAFIKDFFNKRSKIITSLSLLMRAFAPPIGINGSVSLFGKMSVDAYVPGLYRNTILPYIILARQLEHVIQGAAKRKFGSRFATRLEPFLRVVNSRYLEKDGAMRAEYDFLSAIPKFTRELMRDMILNDPNIKKQEKRIVSQMIKSSFGDTENYLKIMRAEYGYTRAHFTLAYASLFLAVPMAIYLVDILIQLAMQLAR